MGRGRRRGLGLEAQQRASLEEIGEAAPVIVFGDWRPNSAHAVIAIADKCIEVRRRASMARATLLTAQAPPATRRPMPCSTHQFRIVRSDLRAIVAASAIEMTSSLANRRNGPRQSGRTCWRQGHSRRHRSPPMGAAAGEEGRAHRGLARQGAAEHSEGSRGLRDRALILIGFGRGVAAIRTRRASTSTTSPATQRPRRYHPALEDRSGRRRLDQGGAARAPNFNAVRAARCVAFAAGRHHQRPRCSRRARHSGARPAACARTQVAPHRA